MARRTLEVTIDELGSRGDGVARTADGPVYVPYVLPGETVRIELGARRPNGQAAKMIELMVPAPERVAPPCRHFGACGGCSLQHMEKDTYLEWKRRRLIRALGHRGLSDVPVAACVATPPHSRRRVRLRVIGHRDGVLVGFNEPRGHRILAIETCAIARPSLVALLPPLRDLFTNRIVLDDQSAVQITETEGGLDIWIVSRRAPGLATREALAEFAEVQDLARISVGDPTPEIIVRRRPALIYFGAIAVEPPPHCFLQASQAGQTAILDVARVAIESSTRILDLFAGVGTLTLPLADQCRVHAVDTDSAALDALTSAAHAASDLKFVSTETRDLFRRPMLPDEIENYDAVIFDPPRAGARRQAEALAVSPVSRVIAVSCNPETFARDARILVDGGYRLDKVIPIDQFLWSPHVELVASFRR